MNVKFITVTAILSSISAVLMMFSFPLPFFPPFIKMDLSDFPALIGAFAIGPMAGCAIELIKNLLHLTDTSSAGIGELANFIIGSSFVIPAGIIYKYKRTKSGALLGMAAGVVCMSIVGGLANYFILFPFYKTIMPIEKIIDMTQAFVPYIDSLAKVILLSIVPFNILKGTILSLLASLSYKHFSAIINSR